MMINSHIPFSGGSHIKTANKMPQKRVNYTFVEISSPQHTVKLCLHIYSTQATGTIDYRGPAETQETSLDTANMNFS